MKVYILEDEPLLRELVKSYIEDFTDMEIVGSTGDGAEAMKSVLTLEPDLFMADIRVPEVSGLEALFLLRRKLPGIKVILFTGAMAPDKVKLAYEGGADAFIQKGQGLEEFKKALEAVREGKRYFSSYAKNLVLRIEGEAAAETVAG